MMTQSHFLISAAFASGFRKRGVGVSMAAILVGSVAPDIPLVLLTFWFWLVPMRGAPRTHDELFGSMYDEYFFSEPVWIASHSVLHAPFVLILLGLMGWLAIRRDVPAGAFLLWFAASALVHTGIDTLTHIHDGPLLLFPFDWSYRFRAPVSYWDPRYGGAVFSRIEWALNAVLIGYFVWGFFRRRRKVPTV